MLTVEQALAKVLENIRVMEAEVRPVLSCQGQTLAEDVYAGTGVPARDISALDGYAVRSADVRGAAPQTPRVLSVVGALRAGGGEGPAVAAGTAVRIMTGAPMPPGADGVIRFEDTDEEARRRAAGGRLPAEITVLGGLKAGSVRGAGANIMPGALVLPIGAVIGPGEIGVAASLGLTRLKVIRRPVVAVIATGEELVSPGRPLRPGRIYNGSMYGLAARVRHYGGVPRLLGIARDNKKSLLARIRRGIAAADAVVTSGGVAMGDYDLVTDVLAGLGEVFFGRVRMAPGKSTAFAVIGDGAKRVPHFALSGNPPAGLVNFEVFVRPAILRMLGRRDVGAPVVEAVLDGSLVNRKTGRYYAWVRLENSGGVYHAAVCDRPELGVLPSIAAANGLAFLPEGTTRVDAGARVAVMRLD